MACRTAPRAASSAGAALMASNQLKFYIDGAWVEPMSPRQQEVINPATEEPCGRISLGSAADVDRAVTAARAAFPAHARSSKAERIEMLQAIIAAYQPCVEEIAATVTAEMGAHASFARAFHAAAPLDTIARTIELLKDYEFNRALG